MGIKGSTSGFSNKLQGFLGQVAYGQFSKSGSL